MVTVGTLLVTLYFMVRRVVFLKKIPESIKCLKYTYVTLSYFTYLRAKDNWHELHLKGLTFVSSLDVSFIFACDIVIGRTVRNVSL